MANVRLPVPPEAIEDPRVKEYLRQLIQALERQFLKHPEKPYMKDRIKVYDVTKQYTLSCASVGTNDVGQVLGTYLISLQEAGVLP